MKFKIVSGGQTGVDRAGLEAASRTRRRGGFSRFSMSRGRLFLTSPVRANPAPLEYRNRQRFFANFSRDDFGKTGQTCFPKMEGAQLSARVGLEFERWSSGAAR